MKGRGQSVNDGKMREYARFWISLTQKCNAAEIIGEIRNIHWENALKFTK